MLLRVLGPLEAAGDRGPIVIDAAKPRTLLAALVLRRGATATSDQLIDALWGEAPPASAQKLLQVYVSQLRHALPAAIDIQTRPTGYALALDDDELDAAVFERLVSDGRASFRSGNPALAASTLRRGLALWRGPAYADVRYEPFAIEEAERLERLRDLALEDRLEADLRLGRHGEILGELRGLLATDPTRERLAAVAMLAAYRSAGPAEALAIFATVRDAILTEFDEALGDELLELRDRIARRDPTLAAAPDAAAVLDTVAPLPVPPSPLVGRERELAELRSLLARPGVRLVSLTGAGGSGKSRLALELARQLATEFANGAVLVDLAPLEDPELVPVTLARALGLEPGPDPMATLQSRLANRETLLVLDSVEHLRGAAPQLVRLLAGAPRLVMIITSQVVLHVSGEHVYPVGPLAQDEGVELFVQRASARDARFVMDAASRPTMASIVRRVDALPLGIELAAARVSTLGLRGLDERLASRLSVLTGGPRDLPARQQTLRETLDWSVRLLESPERELLAGVSVFAGGFTLEAAGAVCLDGDEALAADLLGRLVDASLAVTDERHGWARYRLFDTIRDYATERLAASEKLDITRQRHALWCLALVERMEPELTGDRQIEAFANLETEHESLRAALAFDGLDKTPEVRLRLTVGLSRFWYVRGYLAEARQWLERALAVAPEAPAVLRRRGLTAAAAFALIQGDYAAATSLSEKSLDAARETGQGRLIANGLSNLGAIVLAAGDRRRAAGLLEEAVALAREVGDERIAALAINNLGDLALTEGQYARAAPLFEESLALLRARRDTANVARSLFNLGAVALMLDRPGEARERFRESLAFGREAGDKEDLAWCLLGIAGLAAVEGNGMRAALLLGGAEALLAVMGGAFKPFERHLYDTTADRARRLCGAEMFDGTRQRGAAMSLDEAIRVAGADLSENG